MPNLRRPPHLALAVACLGALAVSGCTAGDTGDEVDAGAVPPPSTGQPDGADTDSRADAPGGNSGQPDPEPGDATDTPATDGDTVARPDWLGTRLLPLRPDGLGEAGDTPEELRDRRFPPPDTQPLAGGTTFTWAVVAVPDDVAARSTWHAGCPVTLDDLRHVTVTFWGFDDRAYVGELLVHHTVADDSVAVFRAMYDARFPLEEMRIVSPEELDAPPTGDGNNTTAFVCRSTVQSSRWSEHAFGLAVDVNPFHNPYVRGDAVVPELAAAYADRDDVRPGMILPDDVTTRAFASIGWGWGGDWQSVTDPMHFSQSGR